MRLGVFILLLCVGWLHRVPSHNLQPVGSVLLCPVGLWKRAVRGYACRSG